MDAYTPAMGRLSRLLVSGVLVLAVVMAAPTPARAGTPGDHPEFPYAQTAYDEPLRGQFHFSSRGGWMNDPNGSFWYRGQYHLFYQHNPHGLAWDTMHWGHATSPDLVHWTQKPIALEPGVHPGDLWSGNGVVDHANVTGLKSGDDDPILVFSGTNGAIIHYSLDGAKTFQTYAGGRKVAVPNGTSRDPKVFWHAASRRWVMVMWSDGGGNGADFFTSTDLLTWTWRSRYAAGWFFECPDMFPLPIDGDPARPTWVLTDASGEYVTGDFDGTTFRPRTGVQRMDYGRNDAGGTFYAGQTFTGDPQGRTVQMVWQPASRGSVWSGNLTFPAELRLQGTTLTRTPVAEIAGLRYGTTSVSDRLLTPAQPYTTPGGDAYEVSATFDTTGATATRFGLRLSGRDVAYDRAAQTLYGAPLPVPAGGRVTIRALVDRGQLEVFGGPVSVSDVVTGFNPAAGVSAYAEGGDVRLVSLRFDKLSSAWGRGEPTLDSTLPGPWAADGGTWTDVADGKQGTASGDGYYLAAAPSGDGTYEADLTLRSAAAAGLTFRDRYTATIDAGGVVKLWRPGRVIATAPATITRDRPYHLKVRAEGARFRVYLDHGTTPVIDATDTAYTSGKAGANVFAGAAVIDNVQLNAPGFRTNLDGPWQPSGGAWTTGPAYVQGRGDGDSFYYSARTGTDFTYEADLRTVNGTAGGITFRDRYTANIDVNGLVKLWRPGRDVAVYPTPIVPGRWYHLTVTATGARFRVLLNGRQVIDATDDAYATGRFGLNTYAGSAAFQNVRVS